MKPLLMTLSYTTRNKLIYIKKNENDKITNAGSILFYPLNYRIAILNDLIIYLLQ